jgi:hypothetical protein
MLDTTVPVVSTDLCSAAVSALLLPYSYHDTDVRAFVLECALPN